MMVGGLQLSTSFMARMRATSYHGNQGGVPDLE